MAAEIGADLTAKLLGLDADANADRKREYLLTQSR
jgi:hypothetical protein